MIATATRADGAAIAEVTAAIDIFSPDDKACVHELWQEWLKQGAKSGYEFVVDRQDGRAVGYICFGPTPLTVGTWDVYWLAVHPTHRRRAIARALLAEAEERMARQNARLVLIETSGTWAYQATRRFYEESGYRYCAIIHDFYAPGDDLIVYSRTLSSPSASQSAAQCLGLGRADSDGQSSSLAQGRDDA